MLKAIIFDFDGVLADTFDKNFKIFSEMFPDITVDRFKDHHNGNVYEEPAFNFTEKDVEYFFNEYHKRAQAGRFFPLLEQIKELRKKYLLFVISSNREAGINKYFELEGMRKYFEKVLGEETHKLKTEKFKLILGNYRLSPAECIFVTDTLGDLIESRKANIRSIAVAWGYHGEKRLIKGEPRMMIHDFNQLVPAINALIEG